MFKFIKKLFTKKCGHNQGGQILDIYPESKWELTSFLGMVAKKRKINKKIKCFHCNEIYLKEDVEMIRLPDSDDDYWLDSESFEVDN